MEPKRIGVNDYSSEYSDHVQEMVDRGVIGPDHAHYLADTCSNYSGQADVDAFFCSACSGPITLSHGVLYPCLCGNFLKRYGNSLYVWGYEQEEARQVNEAREIAQS